MVMLVMIWVQIGYPVVTKPLDGNHGRGVSVTEARARAITVRVIDYTLPKELKDLL